MCRSYDTGCGGVPGPELCQAEYAGQYPHAAHALSLPDFGIEENMPLFAVQYTYAPEKSAERDDHRTDHRAGWPISFAGTSSSRRDRSPTAAAPHDGRGRDRRRRDRAVRPGSVRQARPGGSTPRPGVDPGLRCLREVTCDAGRTMHPAGVAVPD